MTEVFNIITEKVASAPETGLLEVIGPVWCNTTRHFLLIQVTEHIVIRQLRLLLPGSVVSRC